MLWLRVGAVLTLHFTDQGQSIKRGHWTLRSQAVPGGPKAAPRRELWAEEQAPDCRVTLDKSLVFSGWFLPGLGFEGTQKMLAREELGKRGNVREGQDRALGWLEKAPERWDQTLNTNISPRSTATVSKLPSQMLGPYWSGLSVARGWGGGPGLGGLSGFPPGCGGWGGRGGWWSGRPGRRGLTVGRGRVGCGLPSGEPTER